MKDRVPPVLGGSVKAEGLGDGESIQSYFCESYRQFFDYAMPRFMQIAAQIRTGALVRPRQLT